MNAKCSGTHPEAASDFADSGLASAAYPDSAVAGSSRQFREALFQAP